MPMTKAVIKTINPYKKIVDKGRKWVDNKKSRNQIKDVYINSNDGLRLHAIIIEHRNSKGFILEEHGYRSVASNDLYPSCHEYYNMGYSLLIPDNRTSSLSNGKFITFGIKESDDAICWINYLNQNYLK